MKLNNSKEIQRDALSKAALSKNRYNPALVHHAETLTGICPDERSGTDTGMEPENHYQQ